MFPQEALSAPQRYKRNEEAWGTRKEAGHKPLSETHSHKCYLYCLSVLGSIVCTIYVREGLTTLGGEGG